MQGVTTRAFVVFSLSCPSEEGQSLYLVLIHLTMNLLNGLSTHCHIDKYFCWQNVLEAPYPYTHT